MSPAICLLDDAMSGTGPCTRTPSNTRTRYPCDLLTGTYMQCNIPNHHSIITAEFRSSVSMETQRPGA